MSYEQKNKVGEKAPLQYIYLTDQDTPDKNDFWGCSLDIASTK